MIIVYNEYFSFPATIYSYISLLKPSLFKYSKYKTHHLTIPSFVFQAFFNPFTFPVEK